MERTCTCPLCGKEFTTDKNAKKYCSAKCRKKANTKPKGIRKFTCSWCGTDFFSAKQKKYCCKSCLLYANGRLTNIRKKEKEKNNFMSIEEVARASREMNMSAGEYMVKYCYGKE